MTSPTTTLPDEGRPWQYINELSKAYRVRFHSGLTSLFPGVDKGCLPLASLINMSGNKKVLRLVILSFRAYSRINCAPFDVASFRL